MKKNKIMTLLFFLLLIFPINIKAKETVTIHLFYSNTCPHCEKEIKFLKKISNKYDNIIFKKYEITTSEENDKLLSNVKKAFNDDNPYIPYTIIGTQKYVGYNQDIGNKIERTIKYYSDTSHRDIVSEIINNQFDIEKEQFVPDKIELKTYKIPFLGEVDPINISLPLVTIVIAVVDGFNPCAMWVLIFLLSMLIGMNDKKKMITLGLVFILTSALIYLLFMVAWLKVIVTISTINWIKTLIAIVAIIGGLINLRSFYKDLKDDSGCRVTNNEEKKNIAYKIRRFTTEKSFFLALLGVITLAISVNIVELACSAGLPLIYTQILALNNLTKIQYILYLILYILFFLIDDIIIFMLAIKTFEVTGISTRYTKYSHLIGGIIMLIIGILLLINPRLLSF